MRAVIGFIGLHAALVACGIAVLRGFGLYPVTTGRRAVFAALGPGLLVGVALVLPLLTVLLVVGIPLTLITVAVVAIGLAAIAELIARRRRALVGSYEASGRSSALRWWARAGAAAAGAYAVLGAFALARLPTGGDDARIWSLRGLTLAYYHGLQPEIFQNPNQAGIHPVYPLFQPVLEAVLSQAVGHPQLRLYHTELWLLFGAAVWTAGYLIVCTAHKSRSAGPVWLAALVLLAAAPAAIHNIVIGYADITGSAMLATGGLALGLWIDRDEGGYLALAAVLLAAAASTKDEDLVAAALVLLAGGVVAIVSRRAAFARDGKRRLWLWSAGASYFALVVAPWRIWTAAHHLSDRVEPPLPRAISPAYILDRTHQLHLAATAMVTQTLSQWGWLAAIFISACIVCLITRTARRATCFYLATVAAVVISLLWLYTTTRVSLAFLLPTSMDRTVDAFMVLAALATAHLLAALVTARSTSQASARPSS